MSHYHTLFIFRRDLRIEDNLALYEATKLSQIIYPIFIFNPKQVDPKQNKYYSPNSFRFMLESLADLKKELPLLRFYYGDETTVIKSIIKSIPTITAISFNRDYTPFARNRDEGILKTFPHLFPIALWGDYSLVDIPNMKKPYKVYGAFLKSCFRSTPHKPLLAHNNRVFRSPPITQHVIKDPRRLQKDSNKLASRPMFKGGRQEAKKRLRLITSQDYLKSYNHDRDFPSKDGTSLMSGWLKYGCVSVRELYWKVRKTYGKHHGILRELYWRAFYEQMVYWWPETLQGQISKDTPNKAWSNTPRTWNNKGFNLITNGKTGIPIIDASIRALTTTGFLHNRLRMILCMYAVRHEKIDWRLMERWFATKLIDYYPPSNRGGWEWAVIYRFKLSPERQTKRFDPEHKFINTWIKK
jgi:deoxyribodipyrimidine photo-lyase